MSKLLVVIIVFLLVFKPQDLPGFVKFASKVLAKLNKLKRTLVAEWYQSLQKDINLEKNNKKAQDVDLMYMEKNKNSPG